MNPQNISSSSDSTMLAVPKLRDDGSNWSDYYPRIQNAMGAKGLWRHVLGTATVPVPYVVSQGKPMLSDGKTPATEDQLDAKETKIIEFETGILISAHSPIHHFDIGEVLRGKTAQREMEQVNAIGGWLRVI